MAGETRIGKGPVPASGLVARQLARMRDRREFALARLMVWWEDLAGEEIARLARPVKLSRGRQSLGATLTLLVRGAAAPILAAEKERLRERLNAALGPGTIGAIRLTQTAGHGMAESAAPFVHASAPRRDKGPTSRQIAEAEAALAEVSDPGLRRALALLAANLETRRRRDREPRR